MAQTSYVGLEVQQDMKFINNELIGHVNETEYVDTTEVLFGRRFCYDVTADYDEELQVFKYSLCSTTINPPSSLSAKGTGSFITLIKLLHLKMVVFI